MTASRHPVRRRRRMCSPPAAATSAPLFVSMARRHPEGRDAEYLRWHTLDHRPEQHRLSGVRASLRLVSTPDCRAARAHSDERFDAIDHVMTYFFTDQSGLTPSSNCPRRSAMPTASCRCCRRCNAASTQCSSKVAAPRVKVGADVLPWWPIRGVYLLLETRRRRRPTDLIDVDGVARSRGRRHRRTSTRSLASAQAGQRSRTASSTTTRSRPPNGCGRCSQKRWKRAGVEPLLAAPFYPVVPYEWDRYVPIGGLMRIGLMVGSDKERSRADRLAGSARRRKGRRGATVSRRSGSRRCPAISTR